VLFHGLHRDEAEVTGARCCASASPFLQLVPAFAVCILQNETAQSHISSHQ
jgi:hypothetical protein